MVLVIFNLAIPIVYGGGTGFLCSTHYLGAHYAKKYSFRNIFSTYVALVPEATVKEIFF
jgi:hypothetical protein